MLPTVITVLLVLVGLINFAPVVGLLSAGRLKILYGIPFEEPNLIILMRHRALLFGVVGGFLLYAAFHPALHPIAFVMAFISMLGYILLAWQVGDYNPQIKKVMLVDVVGLLLLAIAAAIELIDA